MMKSLLLFVFSTLPILAIPFVSYSNPFQLQDSSEVVFKDTMHVRGKVMDEKGNPLRGIEVSGGYYKGLVRTLTKADGKFFLKNVQPNDTLFFDGGNRYAKFIHEGSRILNVTLSELRQRSLEGVTVAANRQVSKELKNSTIKIEERGGIFIHYGDGPEPYGGYSKFVKNLATKLIYPEKAVIANIEGAVKIQFTIDSLGKPTDFQTIQGLGYGCEEAVIKALTETKWRPGIYNGYPYYPAMSVKVLFKLEDL